jgi:hypothetical protein
MSYGVLWSENGEPAYAGKLEVSRDRLVLEGSGRGRREHEELRPEEIEGVRVGRSKADRLGGRAVLVLERKSGEDVRVAPIGAVGVLHELLDVVDGWRGSGGQAASKSA